MRVAPCGVVLINGARWARVKGVGAGREPEPVPVVATREACYDPSTSGRRVPYGRHYERHFPDRGRSFHPDWNDLKGARSGQRAADAEWTSQTFSTVPAFPSVRATALPTNLACASPYSFRIFDVPAFGYLRERLFCEQRVFGSDLWLSRDMRQVITSDHPGITAGISAPPRQPERPGSFPTPTPQHGIAYRYPLAEFRA